MSYVALYRKWRPLVFEDVVEQEHVVKTLKNSISSGRIAHAYLFCGTRGTGKTTMAKIFSRAINCLSPHDGNPCNTCEICRGILTQSILDVVEIDAASNNSVDNVREIRDEVVYAPSQAKYKVYIIDEVHMLSMGAFNALLKTLEEPPSHVVFILATTEPHKLPATILSRCQRFEFRRIPLESIMGRIQKIAQACGVQLEDKGARLIARVSDGALRDAISILDQCMAVGNSFISYTDVLAIIGMVNDAFMGDMIDCVIGRDVNGVLDLVEKLMMSGKDLTQFVSDLVLYLRNLLICGLDRRAEEMVEASEEALERMRRQSGALGRNEIIYMIKELSALESTLKWSTQPRILLEVYLIKLCERTFSIQPEDILDRLANLENKVSHGQFIVKSDDSPTYQVTPPKEPAATAKSSVKATEAAPMPPAGSRKELAVWSQVIEELKGMRKMALYSYILGTTAVELDERQVGIIFPEGSAFNRMVVGKAENLEILEELLTKKLGRAVKARCIDKAEQGSSVPEEKDAAADKVKELADRMGVPFHVIDE